MFLDFLLGLAGSAFDYGLSKKQQNAQNKFNAQQAQINRDYLTSEREATQDWNLEQWNRENLYNSPKEQLQRLLEAGFNPNTALNQLSTVAPGSVRTSPQSSSPASSVGMFNTNFSGAFQRYNESKLIDAQIRKVEQDIVGTRADNTNKQRAYDDSHNMAVENIENAKKLGKKYDIELSILEIEESASQANLDFILDSFSTRLEQLNQDLTNSQQQGVLLEKQEELLQEQIDTQNIEQAGKSLDNQIKEAQLVAEKLATEIFEQTGIRPTDATTSVFAKAYQLQLQGKHDSAKKLLEEYGNYLRKVRDNTQYPSIDSSVADMFKPTTNGVRNFMDSLWNNDFHLRNHIARPLPNGTPARERAGWPRFPNFPTKKK